MLRARFHSRLPSLAPLAGVLDRARGERVEALLAAHGEAVAESQAACARLLDPGPRAAVAEERVDLTARRLLAALRDGGRAEAGALARGAVVVDDVLRSELPELLDTDLVPPSLKRLAMRSLHDLNRRIGAYGAWSRALVTALDGVAEGRPAHVYDLAAGTGGFARWLAAHPPAGRPLRITSSDLDPRYVAIGERAAAATARGAALHFAVRDALDLRGLDDVDLFVCTQATHHLSPGQVVRMMTQAAALAPAGLLVIDVLRSLNVMMGTAAVASALTTFPLVVADGMQSVRRGYTPAELRLLSRLGGVEEIHSATFGPGHLVLHARNLSASSGAGR